MDNKEKTIGPEGNKVVYEEKAPFSRTIRLLMAMLISILALSIIATFFVNEEPFEGQLILIVVVMVISFVVWGFFKMKFRITEKGVEVVMPPFSYRVRFFEIKYISTTDIPWYVGWGLRIWGRRLAFVSMHKKAVKIEKEKGFFKALVITTRDPDEFAKKVKKIMALKPYSQ